MAIFRGSRYRQAGTIQVADKDGQVENYLGLRETTDKTPLGSTQYLTEAGDTFETLAAREYGNAEKWYVLADVNTHIFWPLDLEAGTPIAIPPKSYAELV